MDIALNIGLGLLFAVWVYCIASWFRRGFPVPRYLHLVAAALTVIALVFLGFALSQGGFDWRVAVACVVLPAPATYVVWLWVFGSEFWRPADAPPRADEPDGDDNGAAPSSGEGTR